jgi:putative transposase
MNFSTSAWVNVVTQDFSLDYRSEMARRPRLYGKDIYHHIYAWGNNRQAIFHNDQHYARYLDFLEKYAKDYRVDIIAYALMHTHIHLFVYDLEGRVSEFMNSLHGEYAQYFNRVAGRVGHVFGERFNNKVVQANRYGLWLSRYIHRQAVEAGLVHDPRGYQWTSYHDYLGENPLSFVKPDVILEQFGTTTERISRYVEFVSGGANGPVDWDAKSVTVVGDEDFHREIQTRESIEGCGNLCNAEILQLIAENFRVDPNLLSEAQGLTEKRLRRKIMTYLVKEIGVKSAKVAEICHVSRMAVLKAVNRKV